MLKHFRYTNWIRLLRGKNILPQPGEPLNWNTLKADVRKIFISLPDDTRHIHVVNHLLSQILSENPSLHVSVLVPPAFEDFIRGMRCYKNIYILPAVKPTTFPITEEMVAKTATETCDIGIDLNISPYILSHYLIATRSEKASLGFYNVFSASLLSMTLKLRETSSYDTGFESLLMMAGLIIPEQKSL
ncbi:MAG: hypothetical protein PWP06_140 [Candidatus Marinimicrobia bacterium]|jgi:hypothetical protein|nr:hypothetical protein [Candidatus Neomarinimicrobiota bacterium]